ncbi:MAG: hypothetical protein IKS29_04245 [Oscillospiraceae bacterium]|nr:hypothetical protein [Oscillospiraceae bacterium]
MDEQFDQIPQAKASPEPELVTVADICFKPGGKVYFFDPGQLVLKAGEHVIISTSRGNEFGYVNAPNHAIRRQDLVSELRSVVRRATETDEQIAAANRELERDAFTICQKKIAALGLEMQLVSCEVAFDGSKILFYFTADGRVDFRELVKQLASAFRTRIELRQIGVRDKAKMVGGLGICGRPFCCGEFLADFQPVSIKMAKTQNLSLNPTKISGTCGRLMCCLKYEQDAYESLLAAAPKAESFVDTPEGRGTISEVNLLQEQVKVRMEKAPDEVRCFHNCEICVLRSGKAKKTDPPIPEDLAPISGGNLKPRRSLTEKLSEEEAFPAVRLRGEAPETEQSGEAAQEGGEQKHSRRHRGGRGGRGKRDGEKTAESRTPEEKQKPQQEKPKQEPKQRAEHPRQEQKDAAPKSEGQEGGQKKSRRHRGGRGHKPKSSGEAPKAE